MRVSARMHDRQGRETMGGDVDMFRVDHGPCLMAAVPLADGLDDGRCLNSPHDDDHMESRCDAPICVCGASRRLRCRGTCTMPQDSARRRGGAKLGLVLARHQPPDLRPHAPSTNATVCIVERNELSALSVLTCIAQ
jgi:hypothetical protein